MGKLVILAVVALVLIAVFAYLKYPLGSPQIVVTDGRSEGPEAIVENLDTPWAIAFLPNDGMIFTERAGRVSVLERDELRQVGEIAVDEDSESGLHGVAVDPNFEQNSYVYLYYTSESGNRVSRFTLSDELGEETVLLDSIPSASNHDGGRLKFGPDGKLYVTTGDATEPSLAQDPESLAGKILRMHTDGSIPVDNPLGNYVYSFGHRNPQGITWDETGAMYASEHGPSSHDEVNLIVRGGNYGWPQTCGENATVRDPIRCYTDFTLAPAGIAWANGNLYVTGLRGTQLRRLQVENGRVVDEEVVLDDLGRIREVVAHKGYLYIATSNRDGRGVPGADDDRILRMKIT